MKGSSITIRIPESHKSELEKKAHNMGLNVSEYIRLLILKDIGIIK